MKVNDALGDILAFILESLVGVAFGLDCLRGRKASYLGHKFCPQLVEFVVDEIVHLFLELIVHLLILLHEVDVVVAVFLL